MVRLTIALAAAAGAFLFAQPPSRTAPAGVDVPPGWRDVTATKKNPDILVALRGPETSSFVISRIGPLNLSNRAVLRGMLLDVLAGVNRRTRLAFAAQGNLRTATYKNGASAHYLLADLTSPSRAGTAPKKKPKMLVAVVELRGAILLASLVSMVPETLFGGIIESLRLSPEALAKSAPPPARRAVSADGQLALDLPEGMAWRPIDAAGRRRSIVLSITGLGSELYVLKLDEAQLAAAASAAAVRGSVLAFSGVAPESVSPVAELKTKAGPALLHARGRVAEGGEFAAGYLPWCYWGYSLYAKGPAAGRLIQVMAGLEGGPSSEPKLLAATPRIPAGKPPVDLRLAAAAVGALSLLGALALRWRKS